jgi:NADP-dependent 3-hydroxy acid dehydrogenase YdfG
VSDAPLAGRTAAVTGASRGIGLATVRCLAAAGARVALLARTSQSIRDEAQRLGGGALALPCDLLDGAQIASAVERLIHEFDGAPDVLVLNAAVFPLGRIGELPPAAIAQTLALSVVAPYAVLHAFVPRMRARGSGDIVTLGSIADRTAYPENSAYAAAKYGARGVHEVLRAELAGSGVRATLISPGPVDTPLWNPINPDRRAGFTARAQMLRAESVADAVLWAVTRAADVNIDELRLTRA